MKKGLFKAVCRLGMCCVALTMTVQVHAKAREVVLSERPIEMRLPIDKEVIITFPMSVTHTNTLNEETVDSFSTLLTPDGVLYLTATEPFEKTRMIAELIDGRLVMLDLEGSERGPFSDLKIVNKPEKAPEPVAEEIEQVPENNPYKPDFLKDGAAKTLNKASASPVQGNDYSGAYHLMVQYGFRHFVGPERLIGPELGKRISKTRKSINGLLRVHDNKVSITSIGEWEISGQYLTVLLINNRTHAPLEFDPRMIRGRWIFAAALHPVVEPRGSRFDQTLWALVSQVPFEQARKVP